MTTRTGSIVVAALVVWVAACGSDAERASTTPTTAVPTTPPTTIPVESTVAPPTSTTSTAPEEPAGPFPIEAFAAISDDPVTEETAARFQEALEEMAGSGGMSATVMTADGTWSGVAGLADGVRAIQVDDQFGIGSITKSIVAAQVMQLVEAGELSLDDQADEHLPADLDFDTNQATIRNLLGHRSGFRDPDGAWDLENDRQHIWTTSVILDLSREPVWPADTRFEYANINYFLLGLIIEEVRGQPIAQVLRDGVLAVDGAERLIYQPDERPSEPIAMPAGESTEALELGGGYLSSIAAATQGGPAAGMASDAPSLARWWRALCTGEIVSQASLTEMSIPSEGTDWYGLGVFVAGSIGLFLGHAGTDYGFTAWAGCVPDEGAVVVVLANRDVSYEGIHRRLVNALSAD